MRTLPLLFVLGIAALCAAPTQAETKKIVIVAGKPSHPPRMHEFNAGVQLLVKCLASVEEVEAKYVLNGWPKDESIFAGADAVIFYMDGGGRHEVVQEKGRRLKIIDGWAKQGVGLGFMHYGVEIIPDQAGDEFKRWIGGHYEHMHSCNPIWQPNFAVLPDHPTTRGVKPFTAKDEWYFNMRFVADIAGNEQQEVAGLKFQPVLVAAPSDDVRDGPYVYPQAPTRTSKRPRAVPKQCCGLSSEAMVDAVSDLPVATSTITGPTMTIAKLS